MADAISIVKTSMLADMERLTTYGQNFANSGTAGYKRQIPLNLDFIRLMDSNFNRTYGSSGLTFSSTDLAAGAIKSTGRSLDVAIEGDGFIAVNSSAGQRYMRRGDLSLDGRGRLVAPSGDPVAGTGGDIHLQNDQVSIAADGTITANGQTLGQLQLVRFDNPDKLVYEGNGLFNAEGANLSDRHDTVSVRQGFLEMSNVQAAQDMLGLMSTSRHFDLIHNAATAYDQMLDAAINDLSAS